MKNAIILTAVISAIFAGSACAKTPVKTPEKTVSQTAKITQNDFDRLENMNTADFLKNSKWTPLIKSQIGEDNHKFLLDEFYGNDNVLVSSFVKEKDKTNNKLQWYSNYAWYKFTQNHLVCITLNTNNDLYVAFLNKNNNINIKRNKKDIDLGETHSRLPDEFNECVSNLILSEVPLIYRIK